MAETIRFEFISQERIVYQDDVNMVVAPGESGVLGILPRHAPLMSVIVPGEVVVYKEGEEPRYFAVGGGFIEVRPDKVTLLARSGEAAEEIDIARAEAARQRAEEVLSQQLSSPEKQDKLFQKRLRAAEQALRRSRVRIKVAQRRRQRRPTGPTGRPQAN